jgi:hypothetical protein
MRRYRLGTVTHHITQNRFGIAAQHRKFPPTRQLCIREMQRKVRQYDASQPWVLDSDDKATLLQLGIIGQILTGLHHTRRNSGLL